MEMSDKRLIERHAACQSWDQPGTDPDGWLAKRGELFFPHLFRRKRSPIEKHLDLDQAEPYFRHHRSGRGKNLKSNELRLLNGTLTLLIERVREKGVGEACFSVKYHEC